jgi:DNA-directed RNA polymerase specialized sigma24 family protein
MASDEAAKVMGKNKKQIYNLLYRAKISLRRAIEEEGFSYEK